MAHDVFISYSSKDKPVADAVCATLEARGIRCWVAPRDIAPGADWSGAIMTGIAGCKVMVLVFSANANQSEQVKREVERAVAKGKALIPLRLADVAPSPSLEYFISTPHWLDALTPPLQLHLDRLATTVAGLLGKATAAARPNPPPPPGVVRPRPRARPVGRGPLLARVAGGLAVLAAVAAATWVIARRFPPQNNQTSTGGGPTSTTSSRPTTGPEPGDPAKAFDQAYHLYTADGPARDLGRAATLFREAADRGHCDAMAYLGTMYFKGEGGLGPDEAAAMRWWAQGAHGNNASRLAMYLYGAVAVTKTKDGELANKGVESLAGAASLGDPRAKCLLGFIYQKGTIVPADPARAALLFEEAMKDLPAWTERGDPDAMYFLASVYAYDASRPDRPAPPDRADKLRTAAKLLTEAARRGNADARRALAELKENSTP